MKRLLALLAASAVFGAAAAPAAAEDYAYTRNVASQLPAAGARSLEILAINGNVRIHGDSGTTIRVRAQLRAHSADALGAISVRTTRQGGTARVEETCGAQRQFLFWTFHDCDVELDVYYPRDLPLELQSRNGNIHVSSPAAATGIRNSNGNIRVDSPGAALSVSNANGNIVVTNAAGNVSISNRNGNLDATLAAGWHGDSVALQTHAGNVALSVPRGLNAKVTARTRLGNVTDTAHMTGGTASVSAITTLGNVNISRE